jgi:hypothetical protein
MIGAHYPGIRGMPPIRALSEREIWTQFDRSGVEIYPIPASDDEPDLCIMMTVSGQALVLQFRQLLEPARKRKPHKKNHAIVWSIHVPTIKFETTLL